MRVDPAIAGLRRDSTPQRFAQAALESARDRWRTSPAVARLLDDLGRYGGGAELSACPVLERAFGDLASASALIGSLVSDLAAGLIEHPLGHVPLRHQYAHGLAVLQLAQAGAATLSLLCYEARGHDAQPAATVCFAGGERRELCLAGAAEARFFTILREEQQRAEVGCEQRRIEAGDMLALNGPRHTKIVDRPLGRMVMLRIARSDPSCIPAREYRIADGELVHRASGDRAESRDEMAAAVLGAMGRADAAPILTGLACGEASDHLRWQALRQALALDTATGFAALATIARDPTDALAAPAGALRASLVDRLPALAEWTVPCPA